MAFEFRDILPAVGAVIGFGFGGPGGAALGSGIGSLARGDEADEALRNAALGYVGGQGAKFLGGTEAGSSFLGKIPGGDFLKGTAGKMGGVEGTDIFSEAFTKGKEFLDPKISMEKNLLKQQELIDVVNNANVSDQVKEAAISKITSDASAGAGAGDSLLSLKNIFGTALFTTLFGSYLDSQDDGDDISNYMVSTDTSYSGFDKPTEIKKPSEFNFATVADGGLMSLAKGGFPRRQGKIEGPGTETSDDIPAMLSDGEFVVNARTVRGLGESMGGSGKMDARERGADFLYGMQEKFGGKA